MTNSPAAPARTRLPWRSAAGGWAALAACLAVGVPLFLRMPLWIDATLYDLAARNVLAGGVHYRDIFDTNTPGFVWLMCAIRAGLGTSIETVRVVDLGIVTASTVLLLRFARAGGATCAGVAWAAAGVAGFYLFVSEFNHAQRDVWMMLPVLAATTYRVRRIRTARERTASNGWVFRTAFVEGLVWGAAVWVKPHIMPVALAMWLVLLRELTATAPAGRGRRVLADLSGAVCGGLVAGAAGVAWLVGSGAWPHFVDVFMNWNTSYFKQMSGELADRLQFQIAYFPPWSLFVVLAVPVAVANVWDARPWAAPTAAPGPVSRRAPGWLYAAPADADTRTMRAVLAALYLGWLLMAVLMQKRFHYVHVPETLLMIGVFAANRWAVTALALAAQTLVMAWVAVAPTPLWTWEGPLFRHVIWTYPDRDPNRLKWWPACFAWRVPGEVRNGVAFQSDFFAGIDSAEIDEVAAFLRSVNVRSGEVMAWNDSPHAVYLVLGHRPPIRFLHLSTATGMGDDQYNWVSAEVHAAAPGVKYVVSDMLRLALFYDYDDWLRIKEPGPNRRDHLPPVVSPGEREVFPFNQPTVFRSGGGGGRYVVHELKRPIGELYTP